VAEKIDLVVPKEYGVFLKEIKKKSYPLRLKLLWPLIES
jgi:hypothetical protein